MAGEGFWSPLSTTGGADTATSIEFDQSTLFSSAGNHLGFPGFVVAGNGDWLIFYRSGADHNTGPGTVVVRRSTDEGTTWDAGTTILSDGSTDYRGAVPTLLADGRIALAVATRPPSLPYNDTTGARYTYSDDHGATWADEVVIAAPHAYRTSGECQILELGDGTLLAPVWGQDANGADYYSVLMASADEGGTWSQRGTIAQGGGSWNETGIFRTDDDLLVAIVRDESGGPDWCRTTSTDDGATWDTPALIVSDAAGRPNPLRLPDGRILAVWRDMAGSGQPGTVGLSSDDGATWTVVQQLEDSGNRWAYGQADHYGEDLWLVHAYEFSSSNGGDDSRILLSHSPLGSVAIPAGGAEGQVLEKASGRDWHLRWRNPEAAYPGAGEVTEADVRDAGRWEVVVSGTPAEAVTSEDETDWLYAWTTE